MRIRARSCYVVGRPRAKFHRIRSSFDSPTDNYSDIIVGLMSDVFGLRKQSPGLSLFSSLIPKLSAQSAVNRQAPKPLLARCIDPLTCASETSPDPTRAVVTVGLKTSPNIYKISLFPYLGYLSYFFPSIRLRSEGLSGPRLNATSI